MNTITHKFRAVSPEVFITEEAFPSVGRDHPGFLRSHLDQSPKGRIRACMHKTNDDRMHEMFIAFMGTNYLRPSLHLGKDESLHMLEGEGDYFFFAPDGTVTDVVSLGAYDTPYQFYCRIPASTEHALLIRSDDIAIHETTPGPFRREDTVFSAWSPLETNPKEVHTFLEKLRKTPRKERPLLKVKRTGEEVFVADKSIVSIGQKEIAFLKKTVPTTARKRVRLCAHKDIENTLHEMFVVYTSMTYVKPNKHIGKDESLHILEGEADFIFFDEKGEIISIIPLGDYNTGRQFYIRVPSHVYHTIIMKSETLVIHEVTPGPFRREDTVWAPWAPAETDLPTVESLMNRLRIAAE